MALHERHRRPVRFKKGKGYGDVVYLHPADARVAIAQGLAKPASARKAKAADADAGPEGGAGDGGGDPGGENDPGTAGDGGTGDATGSAGGDTQGS